MDEPSETSEPELPDDIDDATIMACGRLTEAFEWVERARGRLFDFHQMIGHADRYFDAAADALEEAGHADLAREIRDGVVGRDVIAGCWTYQILDDFDSTYYSTLQDEVRRVHEELVGGRRHVYEAFMKARRRTM